MWADIFTRTDRQTDIHTYIQIRWLQYFAPLPDGAKYRHLSHNDSVQACSGDWFQVNREQARSATSVQQAVETVDPAAAQTDDTPPSDVIKYKYNRRLGQQTTVSTSQPNVSSSNAQIATRLVSHCNSYLTASHILCQATC